MNALLRFVLILCLFAPAGASGTGPEATFRPPGPELSDAGDSVEEEPFADDFSPMLGLFAALALVVVLVLLGVGMVLAAVVLVALAGLTIWATLTASTLAGLATRSPRVAAQTFFLQVGGLVGLPTGAVTALLAVWLFDLPGPRWALGGLGALAGLALGLALAFAFIIAWSKLINRLPRPTPGAPPAPTPLPP